MKITNHSKLLMSFFLDNKCINHVERTNKTTNILKKLFKELKDAVAYIQSKKQNEGAHFYKIHIEKITNIIYVKEEEEKKKIEKKRLEEDANIVLIIVLTLLMINMLYRELYPNT